MIWESCLGCFLITLGMMFDSFLDDLRAIKSDWKYFLPRKTAKYFGSKEGEGSKIMINLGKLDLGTFV